MMDLLALRTEVLNHGFDPVFFGSRVNQYLNDAQGLIARRVGWYIDEATDDFSTVAGTASYPFPADLARMRSLHDTARFIELGAVGLRDIDSASNTQGAPSSYALDGANVHLYPVPDGVYSLEMRYWKMPADLVNDTDTPNLPVTWHRVLWYWAVKECYAAEDDSTTAQYWEQQFNTTLSELSADLKFPDSDSPHQARGMWDSDSRLPSGNSWSLYGGF